MTLETLERLAECATHAAIVAERAYAAVETATGPEYAWRDRWAASAEAGAREANYRLEAAEREYAEQHGHPWPREYDTNEHQHC